MLKPTATTLVVLLALVLTSCRSGPPPASGNPNAGLASRRTGAVGQYQGVIVLDATCSNFSNKEDQIVCIANKGSSPVTIGGWLIRNVIGRTYYFPAGTTLAAGKDMRVHTGAGTSSATDLFWNYQFKPVFDQKDQITLVDDGNVEVATFTTP